MHGLIYYKGNKTNVILVVQVISLQKCVRIARGVTHEGRFNLCEILSKIWDLNITTKI